MCSFKMKNALKVIIFVIIMGTVSGILLVGVNVYTMPLISKNEEFKLKTSVLAVLEIDHDKSDATKIFAEEVKELKKDGYLFYTSSDGAVAFEFHGSGLWGPISGIISLEKDFKTIRKIKITYQEETPGLGGRIAEADYLKQFKRKEILPRLIFMPEGKAAQKNEVDAITGATGSSRAFEKLINENVQKYLSALKR
ncbi:MAG: FMN-binding protein [Candidatus Omnitrophota bacterium]|nr:FMN-binding protein [Candidatus Omnitrophota bacterium]